MSSPYTITSHLTIKDIQRIFSRVRLSQDTAYNGSPCWEWTGSKSIGGYGVLHLPGRNAYIHRYVYAWLVGPVPENFRDGEIDHLCRNRHCCNPPHLELVTRHENIMRSDNQSAHNAKKTHCLNGHPFAGDNLIIAKTGKRHCRTCKNAYQTTSDQHAKKRAWKQKNIDKIRAQNLASYYRNAEENKARMRAYYHRKKQSGS